jgi:hypothetical protein
MVCNDYLQKEQYEDVKHYVLNMLGYPQIKVELDDTQMTQAVTSAVNILANYVGKKRYAYTRTRLRVSEYDVPKDCKTVIKVYYNLPFQSGMNQTSTAMFSEFYLLASDLATDIYSSPVTYWAYLSSREMLTKVFGTWTDFEVIEGGEKIRIYPTPSMHEDMLCIFYRSTDLNLNDDNFNFLRELSLAYAMRILGRIRSKYQSGLPSSGGGSLTLDGSQLLSDAESEIARIKEELRSRDPFEIEVF